MDIYIHSDEISGFQIRNTRTDNAARTTSGSRKPSRAASYDVVSLESRNMVMDDANFAAALSHAAAKEVCQGVSDARAAQLRAEVQSGSYKVDSTRIAEKLLGYRE